MNRATINILAVALTLAGCVDGKTKSVSKYSWRGVTPPAAASRTSVADATCEAQFAGDRQNYLSAVQMIIAARGNAPNVNAAPLETFREEVNAAYNSVVMRCKAHMHCLEMRFYDEAACYMSASDYKDAERRFADLSEDLRRLERDAEQRIAAARNNRVRVTTIVGQTSIQSQKQKQRQNQRQKAVARNGDTIEDQDVLVLCGDASNLLDRRCREDCRRDCRR